MHCAVAAIDPEPGDEIITTPITDMGALAPILYQGAIPVFADVDPLTGNEHTYPTWVRAGATIGARSVIGSDLEIGRFAMVGMGSVVTRSVPAFHLVLGHPARSVGLVCRCGGPLARWRETCENFTGMLACEACGLGYDVQNGRVTEITPGATVAAPDRRPARLHRITFVKQAFASLAPAMQDRKELA